MARAGLIERAVLVASAAVVTLAAWAWLARPHHHHHPDGWSFGWMVIMWQAMMVAMMTPAVVPWLLAFAQFTKRGFSAVLAFAAGYFVVWLGYSVIGAALQTLIGMQVPARFGGGVLIAAGLLQFTPLTRSCLKHCRNPLTYFLERWKNGPRGGFGLGLAHGAYCVGCCWALMLTGFAMGTMNLVWMAVLTVLIAVEKIAPHGERFGAAAGLGLIVWGALLLV